VTSCTKFGILKFQISKGPYTPHASEEQGKDDRRERSRSLRERNAQSDLNCLVKILAGLQVPATGLIETSCNC